MRIDPTRLAPITTDPRPRDARGDADVAKDDEPSVVTLSPAAAARSEGPASGVTARIAKIRELLARDAYPIDLDQLATGIVDDEVARRSSGR
jgi:hypothetical protein